MCTQSSLAVLGVIALVFSHVVADSSLCGPSLVSNRKGFIRSPKWPNPYPHNTDCTWFINIPTARAVNVTFTEINMEVCSGAACGCDYVEIAGTATVGKMVKEKYCSGSQQSYQFDAKQDIKITFHSDGSNAPKGFELRYIAEGDMYDCPDENITAVIAPGQDSVEVEVISGTFVSLHPGIHSIRVPATNCSVLVTVAAPAKFRCSQSNSVIADPDTKMGRFSVGVGDSRFNLTLPQGVYDYSYQVSDHTCETKFKVFDARLGRRLNFEADYDIKCSVLADLKSTVEAIARLKYAEIEDLCRARCKRYSGGDVSVTCRNDTTTISWPTETIFSGDTEAVPDSFIGPFLPAMRRVSLLDFILFDRVPVVKYPIRNVDGLTVHTKLVPFCAENYVYDSRSNSCPRQ